VLQSNFEASYDPAAFEVVHIDTDNASAAALHAHWNQYNPTFPVLVGCASIYNQYGNNYIPYNVVLDTEGIVRYTASGFNESAIHAVIQQYLSLPNPFFNLLSVDILSDDNGDGRPDPGEQVSFALTLRNSPNGMAAQSINISWSTTSSALSPQVAQATVAAMAPGQVVQTPAFSFIVSSEAEPHWADFQIHVSANFEGGTWVQNLLVQQRIARPDLLLVDADGEMDDNESYALNALSALGVAADLWALDQQGALSEVEALRYQRIIWLGGIRNPDITAAERAVLEAFLDRGGLLVLSSQYASSNAQNAPFLAQRFGVQTTALTGGNIFWATTTADDPWFGGMDLILSGAAAANNNVHPDVIAVTPPAVQMAAWRQGTLGPAAAYLAGGGFNSIFCGFPLEALRLYGPLPASVTMAGFLQRAFAWHAAHPATPPDPVTDLSLGMTAGAATLHWTPVPGATGYRVYQSAQPWTFPGQPVMETEQPPAVLFLPGVEQLYFQVRAVR
jgi:hypothetical protein